MAIFFIIVLFIICFVSGLVVVSNLQTQVTSLRNQLQVLIKHVEKLTLSLTEQNTTSISSTSTIKKPTNQTEPTVAVQQPIQQSVQQPPAITKIEKPKQQSQQSQQSQQTVSLTKIKPPAQQAKKVQTAESITKAVDNKTANKEPLPKPAVESVKSVESSTSNHNNGFIRRFIFGNPVTSIAIIILFFGLSYLFKYSIQHDLIPPEVRIMSSLLLGMALLLIGWKLRKKKTLYALILQGGAIGVLYLTLFAAFKLYAFVPMLLTFILLVIICITSCILAVLQREITLAIIACIGGYLTPILLSTGEGNHIALFSYYLLISSAILFISFWQSWRLLNLIGFLFTFVIATIWGYRSFQAQYYIECQFFIIANMLIYGVLAVLLSLRDSRKEINQNIFDLILLFSVPLMAFCLQYHITKQWEYAPAFSALGFGLFYLIGSWIILRKWHSNAKHLVGYGLAIGLGFTTLATPLALSANWTSLIWLIEGTTITVVSLPQKHTRLAYFGISIVLIGVICSMYAYPTMIKDVQFITLYGMMSAILLFNGCLWHHYRSFSIGGTEEIKLLFLILAAISWTVWIFGSMIRLVDNSTVVIYPIITCYIIAVWLWFFIGRKIDWVILRYAVMALWPILILALLRSTTFYSDLYSESLWYLSCLAAFISGYFYLYYADEDIKKCHKNLSTVLHLSLFWIGILGLYRISYAFLARLPWGYSTLEWSVLTLIPAMIILICYCLDRSHRFPIQRYSTLYWKIGLFPIVLDLLYQLLTGLFYSGKIIYWTYIPFINPLEEVAIFAIMMLVVWLNKFRVLMSTNYLQNTIKRKDFTFFVMVFITGLILLWANSIMLRSLSEWLDVTWSFYDLWKNQIIQVVLSLVWTLIAVIFVTLAHYNSHRIIWFIGVFIQLLIVIKLVFVDSVELEGLMKASVFIGVALLMLVIGYLAPLPPKATTIQADKNENNSI